MGTMSRTKGQSGEREIAALIHALTGWDVRRKVRQHEGDSDLEGIPGWAVEVKRHASIQRGDIARWWMQGVSQAVKARRPPALFIRADCGQWRAVWPLVVDLGVQSAEMWASYTWAVEGTPDAWAATAREIGQH
jgi:hypothetical protein